MNIKKQIMIRLLFALLLYTVTETTKQLNVICSVDHYLYPTADIHAYEKEIVSTRAVAVISDTSLGLDAFGEEQVIDGGVFTYYYDDISLDDTECDLNSNVYKFNSIQTELMHSCGSFSISACRQSININTIACIQTSTFPDDIISFTSHNGSYCNKNIENYYDKLILNFINVSIELFYSVSYMCELSFIRAPAGIILEDRELFSVSICEINTLANHMLLENQADTIYLGAADSKTTDISIIHMSNISLLSCVTSNLYIWSNYDYGNIIFNENNIIKFHSSSSLLFVHTNKYCPTSMSAFEYDAYNLHLLQSLHMNSVSGGERKFISPTQNEKAMITLIQMILNMKD
eukprot:108614_1